jgi:alpha-L-arabinofuranosidase
MISFFPVETWKHRPNGLRKDLVQLLYDLHPGFIRFPGGCSSSRAGNGGADGVQFALRSANAFCVHR